MDISISAFGAVEGQLVDLIELRSDNGHRIQISNYGGIIHKWECPDRNGEVEDILLGCRNLNAYLSGHPYFGAIIGRYANRIAHGRFSIDGQAYTLAQNLNGHHLHGGTEGFDKKIWRYKTECTENQATIQLNYTSPHMEEGYPGKLDVSVTYIFEESGKLRIQYRAETDAPTHINLTNHCYFNLSGHKQNHILNHLLRINADSITESDASLIPTGKYLSVGDTPFDFKSFRPIGERIRDENIQLKQGSGYDHNYVLNEQPDRLAAEVWEPDSGRLLTVTTDQPGLQLYTGNHLQGIHSKKGLYSENSGFCLETQHFPDSPNQPGFPATLLLPGEIFRSETSYCMTMSEKLPERPWRRF
jgi:aldose 1-epimerase